VRVPLETEMEETPGAKLTPVSVCTLTVPDFARTLSFAALSASVAPLARMLDVPLEEEKSRTSVPPESVVRPVKVLVPLRVAVPVKPVKGQAARTTEHAGVGKRSRAGNGRGEAAVSDCAKGETGTCAD
jgi:hypothetical protein